ncbi:MAG TPA: hypothetical protein VGL81_09160 [Polyangiaceae bacterium]|jgi:hypothetical protein
MQSIAQKQTHDTRPETPIGDEIATTVAEMRKTLGYLARNMALVFDGQLDHLAANAHASLVEVLGQMTTLDELGTACRLVEGDLAKSKGSKS